MAGEVEGEVVRVRQTHRHTDTQTQVHTRARAHPHTCMTQIEAKGAIVATAGTQALTSGSEIRRYNIILLLSLLLKSIWRQASEEVQR